MAKERAMNIWNLEFADPILEQVQLLFLMPKRGRGGDAPHLRSSLETPHDKYMHVYNYLVPSPNELRIMITRDKRRS